MNIKMVDITLHINEAIDHDTREQMQDDLRAMDGVMVAVSHDDKPHLMFVGYDPDIASSTNILNCVKNRGMQAQLIGL